MFEITQIEPNKLIVFHCIKGGPLQHSIIDLELKTVTKVLQQKEISKITHLGYTNLPYCLVLEQFLGPRILNVENQSII